MTRFAFNILIGASALALSACGGGGTTSAGSAPGRPSATAILRAADGAPRGTVRATQIENGVRLVVAVEGLPPGVHGIHVHAVGTCTSPDFASAGGHWNPIMKQHGRDNPQGMHMGDLPNVTVGENGRGKLTFIIPESRIVGGTQPLLDADGAAIVVHMTQDDMKTDPSGNSGARIACGAFRPG